SGGRVLVYGTSLITRRSSRLYLAFQLHACQPPPYLVFVVGPDDNVPSSSNYLLPEHRDKDSVSVNYTAAGVVSSDDGGGGDGEGGDPVFGSPRQHALLVMLAGVGGADAGGAFLQGPGSAVVLLPRVDTRARVWA
ncbi:unnamed protein product, partial [Musa acuminata subsp. burmannicoides]